MSRIGLKPVVVPAQVQVAAGDDVITIKGPKGTMKTPLPAGIACKVEGGRIKFTRVNDVGAVRALHGLARALAANAVQGVVTPFERRLEIQGVGFRAQVQGRKVQFNIGYSHAVEYEAPAGVTITVPEPTKLVISGCDKGAVGQAAADIRALRPPDAYKGKGIRNEGEIVRLKAGKAAGK